VRRLKFLKSPIFLIAASVIVVVCALEWTGFQGLQRIEWMTYDWRVRLAKYVGHSSNNATNLGVVEIGDNTIAAVNTGAFGYKFGLYWPRQVYARGLDELSKEGAKAVAFDVLFAERRTDQPDIQLPDGSSTSSDDYFARILTNSGNAILAADKGVLPDELFETNAWQLGSITTDRDDDGVLRRERAFEYFRKWHPFIRQIEAAYNLDLTKTREKPGKISFYQKHASTPIDFPTDSDGMIATSNIVQPVPQGIPLRFAPYQEIRVWSMGILLAARQLNLDMDHSDIDLPHHRIVLHGEHGLTREIPVDDKRYFYVNWSMDLEDPGLQPGGFEELLQAQVDREAGHPVTNSWQNKLVVVGSTATGNDLTDIGATAMENNTYLMSKHWNVANSVITGRFITVTPFAIKLLLIVVMGVLAAWITGVVSRPVTGVILMVVVIVAYLAVAVELFIQLRLWVPVVSPLVASGFVALFTFAYRVTAEQSEKKLIRSRFAKLVSPEIVNELLKAPGDSLGSLGGKRREITVFFADIRGFTELTDSAQMENTEFVQRNALSPQLAEAYFDEQAKEVMRTVTLYLGIIADAVKKNNGTLDKYIGDCVMAFWGAPLDNPRHAVDAVRCAIDAQQALYELNLQREQENTRREQENFDRLRDGQPLLQRLPVLSMGSGINTGMTIAGLMGSEEHLSNYTVFGREVNLASRLEGLSGHGRILVGEGTYAALQRDDPELAKSCVELPAKPVKGFRDRVRVFEVPWKKTAPAPPPAGEPGVTHDNPTSIA
jgi:class 3 adenylate cyclase/CHASE2 domain-containing sensor protein